MSAIANRALSCWPDRTYALALRQACMVLVMPQLLTIKNRISSVIIGGGGWGGGAPPLRDHLWQGPPVTRNAEIDPGDNDPPPKMTQGVMTPPNPPSSPSTASSSGVARCWHSNAYFSLFSSLFFFDPPNRFVQIPRDLS